MLTLETVTQAFKQFAENHDMDDMDDMERRCNMMYSARMRTETRRAGDVWPADDAEALESFGYEMAVPYDPELLVTELVNYKGEGYGFAIYENVKHLGVWRSKDSARAYFGA